LEQSANWDQRKHQVEVDQIVREMNGKLLIERDKHHFEILKSCEGANAAQHA